MIQLHEIPHLRLYRLKTYLPTDQTNKSYNSCILLNTNSLNSNVNLMNHRLFDNMKYICYYEDDMFVRTIGTKMVRENLKKTRIEDYAFIREKILNRRMNTLMTQSAIANRNVYYDIHRINNIFFNVTENLPYKRRTEQYINLLKDTLNKDFLSQYKLKTMFIDVNAWNHNIKEELGSKNFNNPVLIIYYTMRKMFDVFQSLGDINIVFVFDQQVLLINPSKCDRNSYKLFKQEIHKVKKSLLLDDKETDKIIDQHEAIKLITNNFVDKYNLVGDTENKEDTEDEPKVPDLDQEDIESITKEIEDNPEAMAQIDEMIRQSNTGRTNKSLQRDEELKKRQAKIKLDGKTIEEITHAEIPKLESNQISNKVQTSNPNITDVRFPDFEKRYNEELMQKDLLNIFTDLSDRSLAMYIIDIKIEDSSDKLNYKETWTIKLEDETRKRHTLKIDVPKFIDDRFMYLGGNKKIIIKQQILKPIVKTDSDTVQLVTNYNKMFIKRIGDKVSLAVEQLTKYSISNQIKGVKIKTGDNTKINENYLTSLEYDYMSKSFTTIETKSHRFEFNQESIYNEIESKKIKLNIPDTCTSIVGFTKDNKPIFLTNAQTVYGTEKELIEFILDSMEETHKGVKSEVQSLSAGKRFMYSRAKSMNREVPLILLLSFFQGLSLTLRNANIPHYFTDKNPKTILSPRQETIRFKNGYLVFDKYPIENALLLYGLTFIDTNLYEYEDFDKRDIYLDIFDDLYGARSLGRYFLNTYESMIDPITKEILESLGYPTDLCDILIHCNNLLADNNHMSETNMNLYRIRSNEIVAAMLYKIIATEYNNYRNLAMTSSKRKMSVKQDALIKEILTSQIVEDYSTLNPIVEVEKCHTITAKGPSGLNVSRAYTEAKRSYDKSMIGILAISTSPDGNCGVVRSLSLEPNVVNARGYIDIKDDKLDELKDTNIFSPAEMLTPIGAARDDSCRTAMATKQSKHMIPVKNACPVLISNGAEQVLHYHIGDDFSIVAEDDGEVVEVDEKNNLVIIKYKNGKHKAIDISTKIVKNGAGGFYLPNRLQCDLKKGQKVKKNDILAYHEHFFSNDINGNRFNIGVLAKTAVYSTGETFEDSAFITEKLADDLSSEIVMKKPVSLKKNANIDKMVKIGDHINSGDELIVFEQSFEEDYLNDLLTDIGDDLQEEIKSYGKKPVKSKYTGEIVDIQIYYTVDKNELSPSLRKLVNSYSNDIATRKKKLDKYKNPGDNDLYTCGMLDTKAVDKTETKDGKIHGEYVGEGVLIEFFIKYKDIAGIGDKFANFCALKSITGNIIPEGQEPFSLFRPEEEVSTFIPPGAILARMTPSILINMFGNKVLVELKRKLKQIYES